MALACGFQSKTGGECGKKNNKKCLEYMYRVVSERPEQNVGCDAAEEPIDANLAPALGCVFKIYFPSFMFVREDMGKKSKNVSELVQ